MKQSFRVGDRLHVNNGAFTFYWTLTEFKNNEWWIETCNYHGKQHYVDHQLNEYDLTYMLQNDNGMYVESIKKIQFDKQLNELIAHD